MTLPAESSSEALIQQEGQAAPTMPAAEIVADTCVDPIMHDAIQRWRAGMPHPWTLLCGEAREGLRTLPNESVDCVVTSPPYFWLRDYGVAGQIGQEETAEGYVVSVTNVMLEVQRILKPTGTLFLNLGDTYYSGKGESQGVDKKSSKRRFGLRAVDKAGGLGEGLQRKSIIGIPWRVAIQMCRQNWVLRSPIIWHKPNSLMEPVADRPARGYEYIFLFVKSRRYFFNKAALPQGGTEDVWTIPERARLNGARDTAPFPDELVQQCLAAGCPPDGVVCDPFLGSGTTMRVALQTGHPAVGIEISATFCGHVLNDLSKLMRV